MLSKCANPSCNTAFNYFNEGKLFEFDLDPVSGTCMHPLRVRKPSPSRELFWLCGRCAATFTLRCKEGGGVDLVLRASDRRGHAA